MQEYQEEMSNLVINYIGLLAEADLDEVVDLFLPPQFVFDRVNNSGIDRLSARNIVMSYLLSSAQVRTYARTGGHLYSDNGTLRIGAGNINVLVSLPDGRVLQIRNSGE